MNARGVALQGVLAVAGLLAAYLTWQREPEGQPGEITVLDISKRALQRVRFEDATRFAELFRDPKDEDKLLVLIGEKPKPPPPAPAAADGGTADGGVPGGTADGGTALASEGAAKAATPPAPPPPPRELRANQNAEALFGRLAPVKGSRALGQLDAKKLEELGLVNSPRKLTFTVDGREQVLSLPGPSSSAPWGTPYALREDGKVFLLVTTIVTDFENAGNRLVDRRLHTFEEGDYDTITISQGKNSRTFIASGKPPTPVTIAPQSAPDKPDEFVRNWHDRVWRMAAMDVLGRGEEPPGGPVEELVRVEYRKGGKELGFLVLAKNTKNEYFARSEHSAGWVRLHAGFDTLANEGIKIASGS
ncbi:hypothetical protein [Hyalangium sp.]|uniref:hypothetical protein n=1 Tax=Hyalangium sp. TaxID=2028555 RepID=UPI002D30B21D|nr:hypothetical protein [Hyalangium sp.]HYI00414.1 hypothetical protein [Hyalangium sp.]